MIILTSINFMTFFIGIIIVGLTLFLILVISTIIESRHIKTNPYEIYSPKIPKIFDGYKVLYISDFHNGKFGEDNSDLINHIHNINPDIIILGGDMIVGKPQHDTLQTAQFINTVAEKYKIYYTMGNHELRVKLYEKYGDMWENYNAQLSDNISWLCNEYIDIEKGDELIRIYGLDIDKKFYDRHKTPDMDCEYLYNVLGTPNDSNFNLLIAHNPEYFDKYSLWGADLTLSGHNHGGIIYLPLIGGVISTKAKLFPHYDKGLFNKNDKYMILSSGLGSHTIKFRFNNIPEMILLELYNNTHEEIKHVKK